MLQFLTPFDACMMHAPSSSTLCDVMHPLPSIDASLPSIDAFPRWVTDASRPFN